jgi:hypothetical protein
VIFKSSENLLKPLNSKVDKAPSSKPLIDEEINSVELNQVNEIRSSRNLLKPLDSRVDNAPSSNE